MKPQDEWMSPQDLQDWLGFGKVKTYKIFHEEIPHYRLGKSLMARRDDVEAWLEEQRRNPVEQDTTNA